MCERCIELDKKIEHYRRLSAGINDRATNEKLASLVDELEAQKTAFHPEAKNSLASGGKGGELDKSLRLVRQKTHYGRDLCDATAQSEIGKMFAEAS